MKSTISVFLNIGYTFGSSGEVLRNTDTWALPPEILISVGCVPSIGIFVKGLSRLILHTSKNENLCTTCIQWDGSGGRTTACQLKGILSNSVKNSKIITKKSILCIWSERWTFSPDREQIFTCVAVPKKLKAFTMIFKNSCLNLKFISVIFRERKLF